MLSVSNRDFRAVQLLFDRWYAAKPGAADPARPGGVHSHGRPRSERAILSVSNRDFRAAQLLFDVCYAAKPGVADPARPVGVDI